MKYPITRIAAVAGAVALAAATLAGCTSSTTPSSSGSASAGGGAVKADIVVATGPTMSNANVYIAESEGIFEKNGLTATNETLTAGSDAIPQLLSGAWTYAAVDTATAITAVQQGVGVVAVATQQVGVPERDGYAAIMVKPDSGITDIAGLQGHKVQVNALGGSAEALVKASVVQAGGDPDKVEFVEIAPPQAIPAIQAGQVDAVFLSEPLLTAGLGAGLVDIANPEQNTIPDVPAFVMLASKQYVAENPQAVKQFQAAIEEAGALANSDHDLVIETAKTSTTVDPAVLAKVSRFPVWGDAPLTADDIQKFMDFLEENGLLDKGKAPKASDIVADLG